MKKGSHQKPESLAKMRESKLGAKNPFYGKTHDAEARAKFSAIHKGKILSDEQKAKISASRSIPQAKCTCLNCGIIFERHQSEVKRGGGKFCCKKCEGEFRKGKPMPQEIRDKISKSNMGKVFTAEHRLNIGKSRIGKPGNRLGIHASEETKAKQRARMLGRKHTKEHNEKIRNNTPRGEESPHWTGGPVKRICKVCGTEFETRRAQVESDRYNGGSFCSPSCTATSRVGKRASNYRGGKSYGKYCEKFNMPLKRNVRAFFGDVCQYRGCGKTSLENGEELSVHHVFTEKMACCETKIKKMDEIRNRLPPTVACHGEPEFSTLEIQYIRMMVPLCRQHHSKMNTKRSDLPFDEDPDRRYFTKLIMEKYGGECFTQKKHSGLNIYSGH